MRPGFTLVEVLIVLTILGFSAGVTVPPLLDWAAESRQEDGVDEVLRVVRSVREASLREARAAELTIDPVAGRYWITTGDPEEPLAESGSLSLGTAELVATGPRLRLHWDARGRMTGDSILIRTARGLRVLTADPWTGRPFVHVR